MNDPASVKLGKYELLERLAVGGMAELYKAQIIGEHGFKKYVAIKKILPHLAQSQAFVNMFVDEARLTAMLEHPNIVQVFEFGYEGDDLFLVMQLVDGHDLLDLMRKSKKLDQDIPTELAVYITHQILDALDFAHNAADDQGRRLGIIHRDISPGNVLVSNRGNVMLTDFGIAWAYERHQKTETGKLKGKFGYMSPEQVAGAQLDARSDVFSTGVVLAELLIHRHLFVGPSDLDVLLMVRDANLERLFQFGAHVPESLMDILRKALSRQRERRYSSAAMFRNALADWLFATGARVTSADVAAHIEIVQRGLAESLKRKSGRFLVGKTPVPVTLSGPDTQNRRINADRLAVAAREAYKRATTRRPERRQESGEPPVPSPSPSPPPSPPRSLIDRAAAGQPILGPGRPPAGMAARRPITDTEDQDRVEHTVSELPTHLLDRPDAGRDGEYSTDVGASVLLDSGQTTEVTAMPSERGSFAESSPIRLIHGLARRDASGLLVVEGRAGIFKEAYFKEGHPQYVVSNVARERLGDYLVANGVLTEQQRDHAMEVMPHFGSHLMDTLTGLGLVKPLDALRLLSQQARDKLVDVCTWSKGRYRWYESRENPWPARALRLDSFEILGLGALALEVTDVVAWAKGVRDMRIHSVATEPRLERFYLGDMLERAWSSLDAVSTVIELAGAIAVPEARLQFLRMLHLLVQCELVILA
jgi:eukaryotic-like serine/threonine-protein kinase